MVQETFSALLENQCRNISDGNILFRSRKNRALSYSNEQTTILNQVHVVHIMCCLHLFHTTEMCICFAASCHCKGTTNQLQICRLQCMLLQHRAHVIFVVLAGGVKKWRGWGNSIVISVSVYQVGSLGSHPAQSACHRKVRFYHCVIDLFPPVPMTLDF